jgi:hypothetical protein
MKYCPFNKTKEIKMSATRDLRSNVNVDLVFYRQFLSNETHPSSILDTADYDGGIMFSFAVYKYVDGTYTTTIYESDDSAMSGATVVSTENLIGPISDLVFTSDTLEQGPMPAIGIVGTKRYVQARITSTAITTGAEITGIANKIPEILKAT